MAWIPWVLSGLGVLIALISLLRTFVVAGRDQSTKLHEDMAHVQERLSLVEMKLGVFWRMAEEHLATMLKKPTHIEMDNLLDKLKAHTLTLEEAQRLRRWLQQVYLDEEVAHNQQRMVAVFVLGAVESLILELQRLPRQDGARPV